MQSSGKSTGVSEDRQSGSVCPSHLYAARLDWDRSSERHFPDPDVQLVFRAPVPTGTSTVGVQDHREKATRLDALSARYTGVSCSGEVTRPVLLINRGESRRVVE
ncbi:hypothetical protein DPEC_G00305880 [Dallia pectoralis]|uniref:Uncharacterized protein n=1 Tax=Dallia pectoralis TaxID=75939 RepID=A0ACC2FE45_DALPE|nr:hypothetical protein DPEC_G00305880 [Dallia pectoralis]